METDLTTAQKEELDAYLKQVFAQDAEREAKDTWIREVTIKIENVPVRATMLGSKADIIGRMVQLNSQAAAAKMPVATFLGKLACWAMDEYDKNRTIAIEDLTINEKYKQLANLESKEYAENWQGLDEYYYRVAIQQRNPEKFWLALKEDGIDADEFRRYSKYYNDEAEQAQQKSKAEFELWLYHTLQAKPEISTTDAKNALIRDGLLVENDTIGWQNLCKHASLIGVTGKKYGHWKWNTQAHRNLTKRDLI